MGLRIRTNVASLGAQRALGKSKVELNKSLEKLSTGMRINKAADDAAGLAIAENLRADVRGLNQAKRNANDGVSLVQTAEGGLNEISNILVRLRELSVQGASDTIGGTERGFLNKEFGALKDEIDRITRTTEFNGTRLLVGESDIDDELKTGSNAFPLEIQVGKDYYEGVDAVDQDNQVNVIKIDLAMIDASVKNGLGLGERGESDSAQVVDKQSSQKSIGTLDKAITTISGYRADLGAIQNRLNSSISNLNVTVENVSAARSQIKDVDFAEETARLTQANILQQAGASVLTQANATPQIALSLLG